MRIAVVGLGHIGLPLAVQYASRGHDVVGVDLDSRIVDSLNRGESPHLDEQALIDRVPELVGAGRLRATTWADPRGVREAEVVVDLAPHDIDVMRYLVGSEPVRVYAEAERRIHTEHEDLFNGILKFENGVIGVLNINWLTATKRRTLTVTGERGFYVADYIDQDLIFYANQDALHTWENRGADGFGSTITSVAEGEMRRHAIRRAEPLVVELGEFARAVRDGGPPPVDPHDAMVALLLARKMVESALTGQAIAGAALAEALA